METIYISQKKAEEELYEVLQQQSLKRLQGLTGEKWTDYNAHDPGITMLDIWNYALTELEYRLHFDWVDYLTLPDGRFEPHRLGLFSPLEVFPVAPVTLKDYRKMIIDRIEEVENLWIYPADEQNEPGWYEILVELTPGTPLHHEGKIQREVERIYQKNRNLGEGLKRVLFVRRQPLILQGRIEVGAEVDVTMLFARIYWVTLQFFVHGLQYRRIEEVLHSGVSLDEILDGPLLQYWVVEESTLTPLASRYCVSQLYRSLKQLKGVKEIQGLGFRNQEQVFSDLIMVEQIDRSYTVLVPERREDTGLQIWVGGAIVEPDFSRLQELFYTLQAQSRGAQNRTTSLAPFIPLPKGSYHQIYEHYSVRNDFPECYGIGTTGITTGASEQRKAVAHQLKAYLLLVDETFQRGLKELEHIPQLMNLYEKARLEGIEPLESTESEWERLTDYHLKGKYENVRQLDVREAWAGMLDKIYGENSDPEWLKAYNYYEDSREERLECRLRFLCRIPEWGHDRFKGINLLDYSPHNMPGIKAYITALLGFEMTREQPVVNIFPQYNLKLIEDELFYKFQGQILSHHLVEEELIKEEYMEAIPLLGKTYSDEDYYAIRESLPLLHYNIVFESLFRDGVRLENFRLLNIPFENDRLLLFFHKRRKEWVNLGRFSSPGQLVEVANGLRLFLVMLNRKSETLYVVEHLYFSSDESLKVTIVLPGWSVRMADTRFREACEELITSRLPAHLRVAFRWYSPREMWKFEQAYYEWRKSWAEGSQVEEAARKLKMIIE